MNNSRVIFIKPYKEYYVELSNYLRLRNINCLEIVLHESTNIVSIKSKFNHLTTFISDFWKAIKSLPKVKNADLIISTDYVTLAFFILRKLRLISQHTSIIWYAFFLHSDKAMSLFKFLFRILIKRTDKIIVFSKYETELYSTKMSLPQTLFQPVTLPVRQADYNAFEFKNIISLEQLPQDFYFSGGFTNRDFLSLIEIFKDRKESLVICCSSLNTEINNIKLSKNIILYREVREDIFNKLIGKSKCVIALMKNNNGASGQMLILEAMVQKKTVIASKTNIIEELIDDNTTGLIVRNAFQELPPILDKIATNKIDTVAIGQKAYQKIKSDFSEENYYNQLDSILQ